MADKTVHIEVDLTPDEALEFAQFLKRSGHDDYLRKTEGHLTPEKKDIDAWSMLRAGEKVRQALAAAGYGPR